MNRLEARAASVVLAVGFIGSFWWYFPTYSADLMAVWLAGKFLAMGQTEQIYAPVTNFFMMYPPTEWRDWMEAEYEYTGPIYPFLYPPLWAKVASLLAGANYWIVTAWALLFNTIAQMAIVLLAWRAVKPTRLSPAVFMAIAIVFLLGTHVGTISLQQNQPQVFVSLLLVLTIERARHHADITAGITLAIAAAIKLYPVLFVTYWIVSGNWRAVASFAVTGASLGLLSIALLGWPMHVAFLEQVSLISKSVLMTSITFNLDATLAQLFYFDRLAWVPGLEPPTDAVPEPGWYSMDRPLWWRIVSNLSLLAALCLSVIYFKRSNHDVRHAIAWPLGLTLVALFSPITWVYYFIPSVCFAPVLIDRLGPMRGTILWVASIVLIFGPFVGMYRHIVWVEGYEIFIYQWAGFVSFALLCYGFWQAGRVCPQE